MQAVVAHANAVVAVLLGPMLVHNIVARPFDSENGARVGPPLALLPLVEDLGAHLLRPEADTWLHAYVRAPLGIRNQLTRLLLDDPPPHAGDVREGRPDGVFGLGVRG